MELAAAVRGYDEEDDEENGSGDTAGNVGKLGLLLAVGSGEGTDAGAVRFTLPVLQALAVVDAEPVAQIKAGILADSGPVVSRLAGAGVGVGLGALLFSYPGGKNKLYHIYIYNLNIINKTKNTF